MNAGVKILSHLAIKGSFRHCNGRGLRLGFLCPAASEISTPKRFLHGAPVIVCAVSGGAREPAMGFASRMRGLTPSSNVVLSGSQLRRVGVQSNVRIPSAIHGCRRWIGMLGQNPARLASKTGSQIQKVDKEEEEGGEGSGQEEEDDPNRGYLPFGAPFHTFNIIMILFIGNILCYLLMTFGSDNTRDFLVDHFTVSRDNWRRIYPLFTNAFFQENLIQLLIDCWLLSSVGNTLLSFIGNGRLTYLAFLCVLGGSIAHLAKQQYFLYNGEDELVVRGRVYGPNTFIMGLISLEGLIFRHLTFVQQPPIPYLVLTAFVMALDVWRISTVLPEEHGAATGGALMALVFWALPIKFFGMDKLTAMI